MSINKILLEHATLIHLGFNWFLAIISDLI